MANVELLPCGECGMPCRAGEYHPFAACLMFKACHNSETVRANIAPLQAENERLRAEVEESDAVVDKLARLLAETAIVIKGPEPDMTKWSYHDIPDGVRAIKARAERLAEALREAAGELASIGDAIGHDHPEARRIFTLRANLLSARFAALAQEDRND